VLDALHAAGIEIVSPMFMNQRQLSAASVVLPQQVEPSRAAAADKEAAPEDIIFDKAERAEKLESLNTLNQEITDLESQLAEADDENRRDLAAKLEQLREQRDPIEQSLAESLQENGEPE
jgi:hypothetical protein